MHPIVLLNQTPVAALIGCAPDLPIAPRKGVEIVRFGRRLVIVNHRATPLDLHQLNARMMIPLIPSPPGWLPSHSAVYLEL
jgi:hypothetical protein